MYQQRYQTDKRKQDCYICGNFLSTHDCRTFYPHRPFDCGRSLQSTESDELWRQRHEKPVYEAADQAGDGDGGKRQEPPRRKGTGAAEKRIGEFPLFSKRLYEGQRKEVTVISGEAFPGAFGESMKPNSR